MPPSDNVIEQDYIQKMELTNIVFNKSLYSIQWSIIFERSEVTSLYELFTSSRVVHLQRCMKKCKLVPTAKDWIGQGVWFRWTLITKRKKVRDRTKQWQCIRSERELKIKLIKETKSSLCAFCRWWFLFSSMVSCFPFIHYKWIFPVFLFHPTQ